MTHFKTQQEIWKYVADGGAVVGKTGGGPIKFFCGNLTDTMCFIHPENWEPYVEPKPKTKVWRWEKVFTSDSGHRYLDQTVELSCEEYAAIYNPGYTKVPGSEREI